MFESLQTIILISQDSSEDFPEDIRHMRVQAFEPAKGNDAYGKLTAALQKKLDALLSKLK